MTTNAHQPALKPGDKLDKYEIIEQVGVGGMSFVWKGYDRLLDRSVAIKQIIADGEQPDVARQRLREEVKALRTVSQSDKHLIELL